MAKKRSKPVAKRASAKKAGKTALPPVPPLDEFYWILVGTLAEIQDLIQQRINDGTYRYCVDWLGQWACMITKGKNRIDQIEAELAFLLPHDAEEERDDQKRLTKLAKARGKAKREEIEKLFQLPHPWES